MARTLKYRRGVPDQPGWWYVWPDEGHWLNGSTEPRVRQIAMRDTFDGKGPQLCILSFPDHEHMTETYLFKGQVAGPVPQPTA